MNETNANHAFNVVIVGGGAAGQMAAIAAAQNGARVLVLEQMPKPGLKLLATGGGRANLTHVCDADEFEAAFGRNGRSMRSAMDAMSPQALRAFFAKIGVPTTEDDQRRVYPSTHKAATVQAALSRRLDQLGVVVRCNVSVDCLLIDNGELVGVAIGGEHVSAQAVILASGGQSYPKLGGTGSGYALAEQAGHTLIQPTPALVPLVTRDSWPTQLAGASLSNARVWIPLPKHRKSGVVGDVLFTHRGISGPAVLDISGDVAARLAERDEVPLCLQVCADRDADAWRWMFEDWRVQQGSRKVVKLLQTVVPNALAEVFCNLAGIQANVTASQCSATSREMLIKNLAGIELSITRTEGFDVAFVTRGGVKINEINFSTCQSKLLSGLFFAGEIVDLDGPTGGYNLQWAFASGWLAGMSATQSKIGL